MPTIQRIFWLITLVLVGVVWWPVLAPAASSALFSPDQRVVCNRDRGICYDRLGPSIGLTQAFLGQQAADRLTDVLRAAPPARDTEFSIADDVTCRRDTGPCMHGGVIESAWTAVLFGPWSKTADADATAILDVDWQWQGSIYDDKTAVQVAEPGRYMMRLERSGRVMLRVDCNRAMGTFRMTDTELAIQVGPMTRAACPPDSLDTVFLRDLSAVFRFAVDGARLRLDLRSATTTSTMEFAR